MALVAERSVALAQDRFVTFVPDKFDVVGAGVLEKLVEFAVEKLA